MIIQRQHGHVLAAHFPGQLNRLGNDATDGESSIAEGATGDLTLNLGMWRCA